MSTSRLADQRIRASASQVVGLDVRGPVSQALARAGVEVPPAPLAGEVNEAETVVTAPTRAASRPRVPAARRVVKPFADAPWPTQTPRADPQAALSGLTADERRVHRILLDTLAMQGEYGNGTGMGLSYAEKQNLAVLDLAFIDAEIAKMDRVGEVSAKAMGWAAGVGGGFLGLFAAVLAVAGEREVALLLGGLAAVAVLIVGSIAALVSASAGSTPSALTPRRRIYDALRELALLADPGDVTSDALAQADAVIDRLAGAPGADDHKPRLSLDAGTPAPTASASRTRARS